MRNPSAVLKKLGACLKMRGGMVPGLDLAGTMPYGLSGLCAALSGARAQRPPPKTSLNFILVFISMKLRDFYSQKVFLKARTSLVQLTSYR
jgi:hypothetical protein